MSKNYNKPESHLKNIIIIGDSFAVDGGNDSWITKLSQNNTIKNFSQRGISQYRLFNHVVDNLEEIAKADNVIIFHTNMDRIFVPDHVVFQSRQLNTHTQMDMVANDAFQDKDWKHIAGVYYKYFYDQDQQNCVYQLLIEKIDKLIPVNKIHCSGFDINLRFESLSIKSFAQLRTAHPGNINHLNSNGNQIVYNYLEKLIQ